MVRRVRKKRPGTKCSTILAILCLTTLPLTAQKMAPWLTRSADNARSGWNAQETKLKQASVQHEGNHPFHDDPSLRGFAGLAPTKVSVTVNG